MGHTRRKNSMIKRVSSKVFHVSVIVSFFAQGILFSQITDSQSLPANTKKTDQLWSLTDESSNSNRKKIHEILNKDNSIPKITDNITGATTDSTDWEIGWDVNFNEQDSQDIETFFPVSAEESETCDDFCVPEGSEPEEIPISAVKPKKDPDHIFLLEEDDDKTVGLSINQTISQYSKDEYETPAFVDFDVEGWNDDELEPRPAADISNAIQYGSSVYTHEKKKKPQINFEELEESEENQFGLQKDDEPQVLGKKQVSVAPYISDADDKKKSPENRQTLSAKKNPYYKPQTSKPSQGVFGPFLPEHATSQQQKSSNTQQKTSDVHRIGNTHNRHPEGIIAQITNEDSPLPTDTGQLKTPPKTILINFNNVSVIEYIRFISRLTNKNFYFDEANLDFNVTIISEEETTVENVITALIQELRIHGLNLIEEGNNFIIHPNDKVRSISRVNVNGVPTETPRQSQLITQVFHLNTLDPEQAKSILRPMLSDDAIMGTAKESRHLIITDLVVNIDHVEKLLKSIDAPNSGMVIGQYVVRNAFMDTLIELGKQIMQPIAQDQRLTFVPHPAAKSIFIVSSPFIVERTISVLQHLDNFQGTTRIYDLDDLKFEQIKPPVTPPGIAPGITPPEGIPPEGVIFPTPGAPQPGVPLAPGERPPLQRGPTGKWELSPEGNWLFRPGFPPGKEVSPQQLPQGKWFLDPQNNWYFSPEGVRAPFQRDETTPVEPGKPREQLLPGEAPKGRWVLDPQGSWIFQLSPGEEIKPERLQRKLKLEEELPLGHIDRTKFFIHKLQFRRGEDIVTALEGIANSLQAQGSTNGDLISTILSAQWLEASNSIIITGTDISIEKVKELIEEIDRPLRQVLIEMLILETTIDDSLTYGVSWGTKSGGGNTATAQAFVGSASPLVPALATTGVGRTPNASTLIGNLGYNLGIIGQRLTHNGTQFASLGAMVQAVHNRSDTNVVLNPKIITEDNKTAEIFVGINSPFLSNSIANDEGSIVTTNVEFRDTGTTLRVTPLIGHGNIITLEIEQEVSRTQPSPPGAGATDVNLTPTTTINRTTTTIHVPDRHFVIISGMIQEEKTKSRNQFPCLGGIPILGAAFANQDKVDLKRNLMIFIKPEILDTAEQLRTVTRRQQQIFNQKKRMKKSWKYEVEEGLDFMNIKPPCCDECE